MTKDSDFTWKMFGICYGLDPDIFFPTRGGDIRPAKAVCEECPAKRACLDYAIRNHIRHGVWGGFSERERRAVRRRLRAGGGDQSGTLQLTCENCGGMFLSAYPWNRVCNRFPCVESLLKENQDGLADLVDLEGTEDDVDG